MLQNSEEVRTRCPARESSDRSHLTPSPSLPSLNTGGAWAALRSLPGKAAAALVPKRLADLDSLSFPRGGRTRRSLAVVVDLPVTPDILRTNERTNELMRYSWYPNTDLDPNRRQQDRKARITVSNFGGHSRNHCGMWVGSELSSGLTAKLSRGARKREQLRTTPPQWFCCWGITSAP